MLGPAVGPLLGGFITTYLHWRLIFFINIPIGILGIYLTNQLHRQHARAASGTARLDRFLSVGERRRAASARALAGRRRTDVEPASRSACARAARCCSRVYVAVRAARRTARCSICASFACRRFRRACSAARCFASASARCRSCCRSTLQEGLGMSAFESGSITCASAFGGMFMRTLASRVLHRFGFRHGADGQRGAVGHRDRGVRPVFPRHADVDHLGRRAARRLLPCVAIHESRTRSRTRKSTAATWAARRVSASVMQQMSLGLGVTIGGIVLQISHERARASDASSGRISGRRFWWSALFSFLSIPVTARLSREAGSEISRGTRG